MSRKTERAFLGVLGFAGAVLALVVGVQLMTGGGSVDVAASSVGGIEATAPAAPSGSTGSGSGVGAAPDSLVVSTTAGSDPSTSSSAASGGADSSTTAASADSTSTSTSSSGDGDGSSTTATSSETTGPSGGEGSVTTSTSVSPTSSTAVDSSTTVVSAELSDIEREIIRLTNELRANPAGPQRRQKPMPGCVNEDDQIEIDPETGHPKPARRLTPSQPVSVRMSRDWSQHMAGADAMSHRSAESQNEIYAELGIAWAARGENVAWAVGYELSDVAQLFFQGWRESDGHYCNMMSGAFSEIGVGHVRTDGGKDFATQNFYRPR
ncbi:MAG: CAP domain-containing protein [Acidimicrobiia bacterium]|nr:CAP domain-containing protein [Acidimicrobiia bacterium]MDH5520161.1 CAP domain-containing protein [Acidimicrobiia bacterium]